MVLNPTEKKEEVAAKMEVEVADATGTYDINVLR